MSFKPDFLHHFIEDEIIRGYEEPRLNFYFTPLTMECYFTYTFKSRTKESVNLETIFENFFLNGLILSRSQFEERLSQQSDFTIPAKNLGQFIQGESTFSTYVAEDITGDHFKKYMHNFQIFLKFFIETGSYVDDSDNMWKIILLVEKVTFA